MNLLVIIVLINFPVVVYANIDCRVQIANKLVLIRDMKFWITCVDHRPNVTSCIVSKGDNNFGCVHLDDVEKINDLTGYVTNFGLDCRVADKNLTDFKNRGLLKACPGLEGNAQQHYSKQSMPFCNIKGRKIYHFNTISQDWVACKNGKILNKKCHVPYRDAVLLKCISQKSALKYVERMSSSKKKSLNNVCVKYLVISRTKKEKIPFKSCQNDDLPLKMKSCKKCGKPVTRKQRRSSTSRKKHRKSNGGHVTRVKRLANGEPLKSNAHGWTALLIIYDIAGKHDFISLTSILIPSSSCNQSSSILLTAGHGFLKFIMYYQTTPRQEFINRLGVIIGQTMIDGKQVRNSATKVYEVEDFIIHKEFGVSLDKDGNPTSLPRNDIAMIKLKTPVQFNEWIYPICLPKLKSVTRYPDSCFVIGWNYVKNYADQILSLTMGQAHQPLMDQRKCSATIMLQVDKKMLCTAPAYSYIESGDSGGPLVCYEHGRYVLRGITTFSFKFISGFGIKQTLVNGFTNVSPYIRWIEQKRYILENSK